MPAFHITGKLEDMPEKEVLRVKIISMGTEECGKVEKAFLSFASCFSGTCSLVELSY